MKPSKFLLCKSTSLPDSSCDCSQMPFVSRSEAELTNFPKPSKKMLTQSLLRLNSVGEVSSEKFPEKAVRNTKLGYSKSFDSISPTKSMPMAKSKPIQVDQNSKRHRSTCVLAPATSKNNFYRPKVPWNVGQSSMSDQAFSSQFGKPKCNYSQPQNGYHTNSFEQYQTRSSSGYNIPLMSHPYSPRFCELSGKMLSVMSSFPQSANSNICNPFEGLPTRQLFTKSPEVNLVSTSSANTESKNESHEKMNRSKPNQKDSVEVTSKSIESCVDDLKLNDSANLKLDEDNSEGSIESMDTQKTQCKSQLTENFSQLVNNLKRRNEKTEQITNSKGSQEGNFNLCNVLFQRKAPKKGRPSCRKRKKRQHQRASFSSQSVDDENVTISNHASQSKPPTSASSTNSSHSKEATVKSHLSSSSKSRPVCVTSLVWSPDSDTGLSDNDADDCDSMKVTCEYPNRLSVNSIDSLFKPKQLPNLDCLLNDSVKSSPEHEHQLQSPGASPGPSKSIRVSFSFSVSEDEDSECSFDSFSSSPTDQFFLDFEFGNGLSLEAIIGRKAETVSDSSPEKSTLNESDTLTPEQLLKINADWNKHYPPVSVCSSPSTNRVKVQFADEEDLVQINVVGNEERRGTWFEDGQRFLRRIKDVGMVLSPILSESHRQKVLNRLELS